MSAIRSQRRFPYPRLITGQFTLTGRSGSLIGAVISGNLSIAQIWAALRDGTLLTGTAQGGVGSPLVQIQGPTAAGFDQTTDEISIAGIQVQTPADLALSGIQVGGKDLGVGVNVAAAGSNLFAEILTFINFGGTNIKVAAIANFSPPGQIPIEQDVTLNTVVSVANLPADQTVIVNAAFWITLRRDLK